MSASGVVLERYTPEANAAALALERLCTQGRSIRLSFRRPTFHRRAEKFAEHASFVARRDGQLLGIISVAVKDVEVSGAKSRAAFLFDLRVHPQARRQGLARTLSARAMDWGFERADFAYTYTMAENRALERMRGVFGSVEGGGYAYLVIPTCRRQATREPVRPATFDLVHEAMRSTNGPQDLYASPASLMGDPGYVGSWTAGAGRAVAGCSAWDNRHVLAEVVESVPWSLRALSAAGRLLGRNWPRVPAAGEEIRSWHLFDFFATDERSASDLLRHVAAKAAARGIDFVSLIHDPRDPMLRLVRAEYRGPFCPTLRYRLLLRAARGVVPAIGRLYVDIRDL